MSITNLQNLINTGQLEKHTSSKIEIISRMCDVLDRMNSAEILLKNNNDDERTDKSVYAELYNSYRIICECLLWYHGYRIKESKGHHELAINSIWNTLDKDKNITKYSRMKSICKRRNKLEYGGDFDISTNELATMLSDVKEIYNNAIKLIDDE